MSTAPSCSPRPAAGSNGCATARSRSSTAWASSPKAAPSTRPSWRASIPIGGPGIATSPDADRQTYAQVTTWLWIDGSWWKTYTATATAGRVSATVTATPVSASWSTGDGTTVDCQGPGVEWRRGLDDEDTYCSHIYRQSSAGREGGAYPLEVTVGFEVAWSSNVGPGGTLDGLERSSSRSLRVGEIQAVETE